MPVPRRFDRRPPERDTTRINEKIGAPEVRLVGAAGGQIGIVTRDEALVRAREADRDRVEGAAQAAPPGWRLRAY